MAYYLGSTYDRQSRRAVIANDDGQITSPLPILLGQDAVNPGQQSLALPPAYLQPRRARDYSFVAYTSPGLIGQDASNAGHQATDLPPKSAARARDYTFEASFPPVLIGADAVNPGAQSVDLPPRAPARSQAEAYTWLQALELPVFQEIPFGQSTADTELPPRAAARARDYSFIASTFPGLIGTDAMVTGAQLSGNAPNGRPRAASLPEPGFNFTLYANQAAPVIPPGLSTASTELAPKIAPRSRDYTYLQQTQGQLIGQDAMTVGEQSFDLPTPARQRASSLGDPGTNFTLALNAAVVVSLPPGVQAFEIPPKAQPRARDYTQIDRLPNLIGQDAMATGQSTDRTALPPRGPARARDYTWLQSMPLHIYQQLPPGNSTALTEGPPRGPLRARDYTFLDLTKRQLIGQDTMYGAPGEVPAYDWQLPTPPRKRMQDYTYLLRFDLPELASQLHPGEHTLTDYQNTHTLTERALFEHTLSDSALMVHTVTSSVAVQ